MNGVANHTPGRTATTALCAAAIAAVSLHALFLFVFPGIPVLPHIFGRTWGFDFISYFPVPVIVAFYAAALAVSVPWSAGHLFRFVSRVLGKKIAILAPRKEWVFLLVALGSIPCFWFCNAKYGLLGDNFLRIDNAVRNTFLPNESGTIFILHYFFKIMHGLFSADPATALRVFSNLCGGIFIYISLHIADDAGKSLLEKAAIFLFFTCFCTIQHFCGYIEDYAVSIVLLTVYLYVSVRCIKGKTNWILPVLCLVTAISYHLISLMFAPTILYVLYEAKLKKYAFFRQPWVWIVLLTVIAVCLRPFALKHVFPFLYPLTSVENGAMSMFSLAHLWEFANSQLCACGPGLILALGGAACAVKQRKRLTPELLFLLAASGCVLAGLFGYNEILGSADWDVYSYASLAVNLFGICLFFHLFWGQNHLPFVRYAVVVCTGLMALHAGPFIALNASTRSILRFEKTVMSDPGSYYITHPQPLHVGIVLEANGLNAEAVEFFKTTYIKYPANTRNGFNYFKALCKEKQVVLARTVLFYLQKKDPVYYLSQLNRFVSYATATGDTGLVIAAFDRFYELYRSDSVSAAMIIKKDNLGNYLRIYQDFLIKKKDIDKAELVCKTALALDQSDGSSYYNLARALFEKGEYEKVITMCVLLAEKFPDLPDPRILGAKAFLRKQNAGQPAQDSSNGPETTGNPFLEHAGPAVRTGALVNNDSARVYCAAGIALANNGRLIEALDRFNKALLLDPRNADAHRYAGVMYAKTGRQDDAIAHCEEALRLNPRYAEAHSALGALLGEKGFSKEALDHFNEALRIDTHCVSAHNDMGKLLAELGKLDEAISHCNEALRLNPRFAEAHNNLGVALAQKGQLEDAIGHFKESLLLMPGFPIAKTNLEHAQVLMQDQKQR